MAEDFPDVMSPADVAAKLTELSANYSKENPVTELTPEQANARLQEMTKQYRESTQPKNSAADAAALGSETPPRDFETVTWPEQSTRNKLSTIETLREQVGTSEEGIAMIIRGDTFDPSDVAIAQQWKRDLMGNKDLANLILSGDKDAVRALVGISAILASAKEAELRALVETYTQKGST